MKRRKDILPISYLFVLFIFIFFSTVLYQTFSFTSIQSILLTHSKLIGSTIVFSLLFFIYFMFQEKIRFDFIHLDNFAIDSVKRLQLKKENYLTIYSEGKTKLNRKNIRYLVKDIPRHGYLNYTNRKSLPNDYFKLSREYINKETKLYFVLSETGSPASEVLSLFTHEEYNHISLSFDRSLYTMLSYNGGNSYQEPGLNAESLSSLNQKEDSRLVVYSLKVDKADRFKILNRIKQINEQGSAYNVLGLLTNVSIRPNMMYCSQFVYQMLEEIHLNYFPLPQNKIKPTDFIDYDHDQTLTLEYRMSLSKDNKKSLYS